MWVHRNRDCRRAAPPRMLQRCQDVRSRAARGDPDHHVVARQFFCAQIALRVCNRILRAFHCAGHRRPAAGNQCLHEFRRSSKGWRALRGVQHGHAPARARTYINQPSTVAYALDDGVDRARDGGKLPAERSGHFAVLAVHQAHNLHRGHAVEICRRAVPLLGAPAFLGLRWHLGIIAASVKPHEEQPGEKVRFAASSSIRSQQNHAKLWS